MPDIQRADRAARRRLLLVLAVLTLLGVLAVVLVDVSHERVQRLIEHHGEVLIEHPGLVALAFGLLSLPVIAGMIWCWRLGAEMVAAERYPPPGRPVYRDTPVERGAPAVRRGRLVQGLALIVLALTAAVPVVLWMLLRSLS